MSLGVKIASILTCLALTAVGFASWLILKPSEEKTVSGSFTVYSVEDNKIEITVTPTEANKIVFGHDGTSQTGAWLQYEKTGAGKVDQQVLTASFDVTVSSQKTNGDPGIPLTTALSSIDLSYALDANASAFETAVANKYLANPVVTVDKGTYADNKIAINTLGLSATDTSVTIKVTVTFAWGEAFDADGTADTNVADNQNPYTFFNNKEYSDTLATQATTALNAIKALENTTYKLTIDTTNA